MSTRKDTFCSDWSSSDGVNRSLAWKQGRPAAFMAARNFWILSRWTNWIRVRHCGAKDTLATAAGHRCSAICNNRVPSLHTSRESDGVAVACGRSRCCHKTRISWLGGGEGGGEGETLADSIFQVVGGADEVVGGAGGYQEIVGILRKMNRRNRIDKNSPPIAGEGIRDFIAIPSALQEGSLFVVHVGIMVRT